MELEERENRRVELRLCVVVVDPLATRGVPLIGTNRAASLNPPDKLVVLAPLDPTVEIALIPLVLPLPSNNAAKSVTSVSGGGGASEAELEDRLLAMLLLKNPATDPNTPVGVVDPVVRGRRLAFDRGNESLGVAEGGRVTGGEYWGGLELDGTAREGIGRAACARADILLDGERGVLEAERGRAAIVGSFGAMMEDVELDRRKRARVDTRLCTGGEGIASPNPRFSSSSSGDSQTGCVSSLRSVFRSGRSRRAGESPDRLMDCERMDGAGDDAELNPQESR